MIYVTQGFELGIGLEVFLKAFLLLSSSERKKITLVCHSNDLRNNLELLKIPKPKGLLVRNFETLKGECHSLTSLKIALTELKNEDILLTLPTSKDQLGGSAGYTEYLRNYFRTDSLSMNFSFRDANYTLITDHIPLKDVPSIIDSSLIVEKVKNSINGYKEYFDKSFTKVVLTGINPHSGENGVLGTEDSVISESISKLERNFPEINFIGPVPGDTTHFYGDKGTLKVFCYHDQALSLFKGQYHLGGLNITLGLPFLRMSVDHGTAPDLFGKGEANCIGALELLTLALKISRIRNERN